MNKPIVAFSRILPALVMASALAVIYAEPAAAQSATSLKCKGCLTSKQLKNGAIKGKDLKDSAVTSSKIADGTVGNTDLADDSVTSDNVADGAIGNADLAADAVDSAKVADDSLTASDLAAGSVGASELGANAVTSGSVLNGSLTSNDLAADSVTAAKIAPGAVGASEVATGSIPATDLSNEAGADFDEADESIGLSGADTVIRSVEITAPSAGVIIANASGYIDLNDDANSMARCNITKDSTVLDIANLILEGGHSTASQFVQFGATRGFDVTAAGTTTIRLVCDRVSGFVDINDTRLTVMFFPTRL